MTVTAKPSVANVGSPVLITCESIWDGLLSLHFSWDEALSASGYTEFTTENNMTIVISNLTIEHARKAHEGKYSCKVGPSEELNRYILGPTVTTSVHLKVVGKGTVYCI